MPVAPSTLGPDSSNTLASPSIHVQFDLFPDVDPVSTRGIGGSELAPLLGLSPMLSAHDLWRGKTDRPVAHIATAAQARGVRLEPVVRKLYERESGEILLPGVRKKHLRWIEGVRMRAATDGMLSGGRVFEAKTTRRGSRVEARYRAGSMPITHALQVQHYASVLHAPGGVICCLVVEGDTAPWDLSVCDLHIVRWRRHDALIEVLDAAVKRWFSAHIVADQPPPPRAPEADDVEVLLASEAWIERAEHLRGLAPMRDEDSAQLELKG